MTLTLNGNGSISGLGDIDGHDLETNTLVNISDATFASQAVGRATLFIDESTNTVGINTTTPAGAVFLEVADGTDPIVSLNNTTNGEVRLGCTATGGYIGTESNHPFNIEANSSTKVTVLANGNVGIGTTSPGQLLHVDAGAGGSNAELTLRTTGFSANQVNLIAQVSPEVIGYVESSERALGFKADGDEWMRITTDGNVGINITNPTAKLHVQDNSSAETNVAHLRNYNSDATNSKTNLRFDMSTSTNQGGTAVIQGVCGTDAGGTDAQNDGGLRFLVSSGGGGTLSEAATFTKLGNLAFPSGNGIEFDAVGSGATGTSLDAYEEGTFTPVIGTISGNSFTTYTTQPVAYGNYVKIGELVFLTIYFTGVASGAPSATDSVGVGNFPFVTASDNTSGYSPVSCWPYTFWDGTNVANGAQLISRTQVGRSFLFLQKITVSGGAAGVVSTDMVSSINLMLSVCYIAV